MKKRFKYILFGLMVMGFLMSAKNNQAITASEDYTTWSDQGVIYTAPAAGDAYYPSVIYDANGFGVANQKYKMWYSDGLGAVYLVTSSDGMTWGARTTMVGITNAHHTQMLYDASCFGVLPCSANTTKYRVWFWDMGASLYSISSIATAESADGITWINKVAVTQNSAAKLIQDPDSGSGWNRGTYGPINIFYQLNAANTGVDPWNYKYVMYYNGTDGGREYTGLAYSMDGLVWSAYTANPVLSGSQVGGSEAWDCVSAAYGTVFNDFNGYHYIFSGSGQDNGSGGCTNSASFTGIGYASSVDGKAWEKDVNNPIFHISDGAAYRSGRIYTPSIINDGSGILRMYFSVRASSGAKKIAYATLVTPSASSGTPLLPATGGVSNPNTITLTVVVQVNNDNGGTARYLDFPLFVNGVPFASGETRYVPQGTYVVSETNRPGYTINFTGDCDANGKVDLGGINKQYAACTVVNNDIGSPTEAPIPPLIDIVKIANPLALPNGPGLVTYTYTITNIGIVPMTDISLLGDTCNFITFISGDTNNDSKLDVNEKWIYTCTAQLTETTKNTVVAIGHANGLTATHITNATVVVGAPILPPLIHVIKIPSPLAFPAGGGPVTFTITVTNPGVVPLSNVGVTEDTLNSSLRYVSGDTNGDSKLDTDEAWIYTYKVNLTKTLTNTVVASGLANGLVATDFALATVVVAATPGLPNTGLLFSRNLTIGSNGADVKALQQYLNTHGFAVALTGVGSLGRETNYFGILTKRALIKFQKENNISPAVGFFGPITRGVINKNNF